MLQEEADPNRPWNKEHPDLTWLANAPILCKNFTGIFPTNLPCIKPKGGIKISKFLIAQTQRSSSGDMHDRVLCVPLYTILTQVKSSAAFELVEGMLLALYGEC
jgi:hypothetical protein